MSILARMADRDHELSATAVQSQLATRWIGRHYHYLAQVDSTNTRLQEMLAMGVAHGPLDPPAGTVITADYQTAGRGRLARRWEAPARTSLLFSVLFHPGWPAEQGMWLTMIGGVATAEAIEAMVGIPVQLKWPNDLLVEVEGSWRKVAGLLLDTQFDAAGNLSKAILGIGINVNQTAEQLPDAPYPPTSLRLAAGHILSRRALLVSCLERLEKHYEAAVNGRSPRNAWYNRLITIGRVVTVSTNPANGTATYLEGTAEDVDQWGRLLVRTPSGELHRVAAGDVSLRDQQAKG